PPRLKISTLARREQIFVFFFSFAHRSFCFAFLRSGFAPGSLLSWVPFPFPFLFDNAFLPFRLLLVLIHRDSLPLPLGARFFLCRCHDTSKFVDAVSEQFRKICEEVADDWLNPYSDGCVKGPVSDLSLEQDVIAEICKKSKIGHDESPVDEGSLISISPEEDMSISRGQDVKEEACKALNKKDTMALVEVEVCSYSSEVREDHEENSPNFVNHPGCLTSKAGVLLSECPENTAERCFGPSNYAITAEENGTTAVEGDKTLVQSIANICETKSNASEPEVPLCPREHGTLQQIIAHMPDTLSAVANSMHNYKNTDTNDKGNEDFEDVRLEDLLKEKRQVDFWEDAETYELASMPRRAMKDCSYKKRFKHMFRSNFYSSRRKSNNNGAHSFDAIDVVLEGRDIPTISSVSSRGLSTAETCEPEWELI
ncbi:hypothetical protein Taro_016280, partial [Colocasia esculenta]|nr:hypothetical protein [Colocasia esculenta]